MICGTNLKSCNISFILCQAFALCFLLTVRNNLILLCLKAFLTGNKLKFLQNGLWCVTASSIWKKKKNQKTFSICKRIAFNVLSNEKEIFFTSWAMYVYSATLLNNRCSLFLIYAVLFLRETYCPSPGIKFLWFFGEKLLMWHYLTS